MSIKIKPVTTIEEARYIEDIICAAWHTNDTRIAIPDHLTITMAKENGGVVLMAWADKDPVGFCWGFLAYTNDTKSLKHCSHSLGVLPKYQSQKVGEMLKWAQRDAVLAMGIEYITWTYDPLETVNANLNIHKLGATCSTYIRNLYGQGRDTLNVGTPTDRFRVDWWLTTARVERRKAKEERDFTPATPEQCAIIINQPQKRAGVWYPGTLSKHNAYNASCLLAAVPKDYQKIKQKVPEVGIAWRLHLRELFEWAFATGYMVVDLRVEDSLCFYLLAKEAN